MFSTLTINFSEVWPRQILELAKQFNLMIPLQNILKASLRMSWKRLCRPFGDVFKTSWRRLGKTSWRRLENVLKTSWRRLEDVWPRGIYWSWSRRLQDVLKTSSEDEWLRRIYSSWSRCLEDVLKMSFEDVDERRLHQDECLLGYICLVGGRFNHFKVARVVNRKLVFTD